MLAQAEDTYVKGYYRVNGKYVQPYHRSAADGTVFNNYSTRGNTNPYTGVEGTVSPERYRNTTPSPDSYGSRYGFSHSRGSRW